MSKAGWFGILFVGAGIGLLLFFLRHDWVDDSDLRMMLYSCEEYERDLEVTERRVDDLFKKHPEYLNELPPAQEIRTFISTEKSFAAEWKENEYSALREKHLYAENEAMLAYFEEERAVSDMFHARKKTLYEHLKRLEDIVKWVDKLAPTMDKSRRFSLKVTPNPDTHEAMATVFDRFVETHPNRMANLQTRKEELSTLYQGVRSAHTALEVALLFQPVRYYELGLLADITSRSARQFTLERSLFLKDMLHYSMTVDRVLVDMKMVDGECLHKYDEQRGTELKTYWVLVPCDVYNRYTGAMGMQTLSKRAGQFYGEATTLASPPGFVFVGDSAHGRWVGEGDNAQWEWNGDLHNPTHHTIWLSRHVTPIRYKQWTQYSSHKASNKVYYGSSSKGTRYGTEAEATRTRYAMSEYIFTQNMLRQAEAERAAAERRSGYSGGSSYSGSSYGGGGK